MLLGPPSRRRHLLLLLHHHQRSWQLVRHAMSCERVPSKRALDEPTSDGGSRRKAARREPSSLPHAPSDAAASGAASLASSESYPMKASHAQVGASAPTFVKTAVHHGGFIEVSLAAIRASGKWSLLAFMPPAFSHTLPSLGPFNQALVSRDTDLLLVTTDSEYVLKAWCASHNTPPPVPLVSDANWTLSQSFGVLASETGSPLPSLFLIDPQGTIQHNELSKQVRLLPFSDSRRMPRPTRTLFPLLYSVSQFVLSDTNEILRLLDAFQFTARHGDRVCPANWAKGQESISVADPAAYFSAR